MGAHIHDRVPALVLTPAIVKRRMRPATKTVKLLAIIGGATDLRTLDTPILVGGRGHGRGSTGMEPNFTRVIDTALMRMALLEMHLTVVEATRITGMKQVAEEVHDT